MKKKFYIYFILSIFIAEIAYGFSYQSSTVARFSNNTLKNGLLADGATINKLELENIGFGADLFLDDNEYIYNLSSKQDKIKLYSNIYTTYTLGNSVLMLGYLPSVGSEYTIDKESLINKNKYGIKALSRFKGEGEKVDFYVIPSYYINNNSGLTGAYIINFLDEIIKVGASYTHNMDVGLNNYTYNSNTIYSNPLDIMASVYNETFAVGYGASVSARKYLDSNTNKNYNDVSLTGRLDFLGFNIKAGYLEGNNKIKDQTIYKADELNYYNYGISISYSLLAYTIGLNYMESDIKGDSVKYKTKFTEADFSYSFSRYISLNSSIFYENIDLDSVKSLKENTGFLIGLVLNF